MIIVTCIFVEYQTGAIADDSFDDIHMTLGKLSFFKTKFFYCCRNAFYGFDDLEPMIHVVCIFAKHKTGAIAHHCFEVNL